jgi:hypothetical protein
LKLKDDGAIKVDAIQSSLKNMSSSHANLDAASTDRKARLAKLAALKRKQPEQDTNEAGAVDRELPDADTTPDASRLAWLDDMFLSED